MKQALFLLPFLLCPVLLFAEQPEVGVVTRVIGQVYRAREGQEGERLTKKRDHVRFRDTYRSEKKSKMKLLFQDDSLLSLGPESKIAITESIYDPAKAYRSTKVDLVSGSVRALVGKTFTGSGSKFEVHTPTSVAAARGTHFMVSVIEQEGVLKTVIATLQGGGTVMVTSLIPDVGAPSDGAAPPASVLVTEGNFTTVTQGGDPEPPQVAPPDLMQGLIDATDIVDRLLEEGEIEDQETGERGEERTKEGEEGKERRPHPPLDRKAPLDLSPKEELLDTEEDRSIPAAPDPDEGGTSSQTPDIQPLEQEPVTGSTDVELIIRPQCPPGVC